MEEERVWKQEMLLEQQQREEKNRKLTEDAGYPPWSTTWNTAPNLNLVLSACFPALL